ncbi:MAG: sec-independent protein translocase protein TatA [Pseudonocardiales bacterium]|jgi:sec-independent protein translocase protein TatA|nr:sec-independent protein translocase protein TatA [Pseudonocardiales bacterium]MDT4921421.1 sec-independent protein translocase protein TatA [Pseudonocardiales bacterium]MDT4940218.1 sec-independent protein translocase protein TatA [Pseudonocardiales bacterium]
MGGWDAPWHWVVVVLLALVLFGYKKLPDAARSLGRSLRVFKTEIKGMGEDDKAREQARADAEQEAGEPRALPPAAVVKRDVPAAEAQPSRPRPSPSPNSRS